MKRQSAQTPLLVRNPRRPPAAQAFDEDLDALDLAPVGSGVAPVEQLEVSAEGRQAGLYEGGEAAGKLLAQ